MPTTQTARKIEGTTLLRTDKVPDGMFHLVVLQKGETISYKWITREELGKMDTTQLQSTFEKDLILSKGL